MTRDSYKIIYTLWFLLSGGGLGNPLQFSCLGDSMDRGAWWATVHSIKEGIHRAWLHLRPVHADHARPPFQWTLNSVFATAKSLPSCPTLCDPIDSSPPGSPVPGILKARILEWVAISFSKAWKWRVKGKSLSRVRLLATPRTAAHQALASMGFPGKSTGVGCHCLLWTLWLVPMKTTTEG